MYGIIVFVFDCVDILVVELYCNLFELYNNYIIICLGE